MQFIQAAFTPPKFEIKKYSDTILLACQSPRNVLQEATGNFAVIVGSSTVKRMETPAQASRFHQTHPLVSLQLLMSEHNLDQPLMV